MPLYANVNGASREIGHLYANVGGVSKELNALYANDNGVQKTVYRRGSKYYKINAGTGRDVYDGTTTVRWNARFNLMFNTGRFWIGGGRSGTSIPGGVYYIDLTTAAVTGSTMKMPIEPVEGLTTFDYYSWQIDFESNDPNAVSVVWLSGEHEPFFIDGYDHALYISANSATFFRWGNDYSGWYWFRTYEETPPGYRDNDRIIIK